MTVPRPASEHARETLRRIRELEAINAQIVRHRDALASALAVVEQERDQLREALETILAERRLYREVEIIARAALAVPSSEPARATICAECGSGILDGEHIADYACSSRSSEPAEEQKIPVEDFWGKP